MSLSALHSCGQATEPMEALKAIKPINCKFTRLLACAHFSISLVALAGCANTPANTPADKLPANILADVTLYIVPTGRVKIEVADSTPMPALPAFPPRLPPGLHIERDATPITGPIFIDNRKEMNDAAQLMMGQYIFDSASIGMQMALLDVSTPKEVVHQPRYLADTNFENWFATGASSYPVGQLNKGRGVVLEYGFRSITISSFDRDTYISAAIGVKVIDTESGKVIGRSFASAYGQEHFGHPYSVSAERINTNNVSETSKRLIDKLVRTAIQKLFN